MDLSHLLEGPEEPEARPPLEHIVGRSRRMRSRRVRSVGIAGLAAALSAGGTGVGLALTASQAPLLAGGAALSLRLSPKAPAGLGIVASRTPGPGPSYRSPPFGNTNSTTGAAPQACTSAGCYPEILGSTPPVAIPTPRLTGLVLSAVLYSEGVVPVASPLGWNPGPAFVGRFGICSFGQFLDVALKPVGSSLATGYLVVPSGGASGHVIRAIATAVLGNSAAERVEVVVVRMSPSAASVTAVWGSTSGPTYSAKPDDGWAVLAVPYSRSSSGLVAVTVKGAAGQELEKTVVSATGVLATVVRSCHYPIVSPPASPGPGKAGTSGGSGSAGTGHSGA